MDDLGITFVPNPFVWFDLANYSQRKSAFVFYPHPVSVFEFPIFPFVILDDCSGTAQFSHWFWGDFDVFVGEIKHPPIYLRPVFYFVGLPIQFRRAVFYCDRRIGAIFTVPI